VEGNLEEEGAYFGEGGAGLGLGEAPREDVARVEFRKSGDRIGDME
jgi:hypothetical protein